MDNTRASVSKQLPVFFCFFVMGFVDLVGIATNYVKADFALSDSLANLCPSMVFFWFLIGSVPTGILMNRLGRKRTVLLSIGVTTLALLIPLLAYSFASLMLSFALLGMGNTLMQVSLNPLIADIVSKDRLAGSLTFGQFVKAIASFIAPFIAAWGAMYYENWRILFILFAVVGILSFFWLIFTEIKEQKYETQNASFVATLSLLKDPFILLAFIGIMCHVGIDVGTNVTAPKLLIERLGIGLEEAGYVTSIYFLCRTAGCLTGSFLLNRISDRKVFLFSVIVMLIALTGLLFADSVTWIHIFIGMIGLGNSNVFSVIFAYALRNQPQKQNEVSGLMIMGLFGGTVFPLVMGFASDLYGQGAAVAVMLIGAIYLLLYFKQLKNLSK